MERMIYVSETYFCIMQIGGTISKTGTPDDGPKYEGESPIRDSRIIRVVNNIHVRVSTTVHSSKRSKTIWKEYL